MPNYKYNPKPLKIDYLIENIQQFKNKTDNDKINFINEVIENHPIFGIYVHPEYNLFRVRSINKNNIDCIKTVDDLLWPNHKGLNHNRFGNYCYLSNSEFTALSEKEECIENDVVLTAFSMRDEFKAPMLPIGELNKIIRFGTGYILNEGHEPLEDILNYIRHIEEENRTNIICITMQESFIFGILSSSDRYISQYTIEKLINSYDHEIAIIGYPSNTYNYGYNFAIDTKYFSELFDFYSIRKCHIKKLPYKIYDIYPFENVKKISGGLLIWEKHNLDGDYQYVLKRKTQGL